MNEYEHVHSTTEYTHTNTVFNRKIRPHKVKFDSKSFPNRSITMQLYSPSTPYHLTEGIPTVQSARVTWFNGISEHISMSTNIDSIILT